MVITIDRELDAKVGCTELFRHKGKSNRTSLTELDAKVGYTELYTKVGYIELLDTKAGYTELDAKAGYTEFRYEGKSYRTRPEGLLCRTI